MFSFAACGRRQLHNLDARLLLAGIGPEDGKDNYFVLRLRLQMEANFMTPALL